MTHTPVLLGAHMSIAGGIENAYYKGASIDCTALQFFTHSNRQWAMKPLTDETIANVKKAQEETGITDAMVHASYLINLASTNDLTRERSKNMLRMEVEHCANLGVKHLVLHPGYHPSVEEGIAMISEGINELYAAESSDVMILIENMAGQGSQIGSTFEQLGVLRKAITNKKRVGFCIDTCHLWAAGYDFGTKEGYTKVWKEFDTILGLEHLKAIHLNDSKQTLDSHVDRHADIGKGTIGIEAFILIMNDIRFASIPKVLETPGKELSEYAENMKILLNLIKK